MNNGVFILTLDNGDEVKFKFGSAWKTGRGWSILKCFLIYKERMYYINEKQGEKIQIFISDEKNPDIRYSSQSMPFVSSLAIELMDCLYKGRDPNTEEMLNDKKFRMFFKSHKLATLGI